MLDDFILWHMIFINLIIIFKIIFEYTDGFELLATRKVWIYIKKKYMSTDVYENRQINQVQIREISNPVQTRCIWHHRREPTHEPTHQKMCVQ